jgi:hypothetical protein
MSKQLQSVPMHETEVESRWTRGMVRRVALVAETTRAWRLYAASGVTDRTRLTVRSTVLVQVEFDQQSQELSSFELKPFTDGNRK